MQKSESESRKIQRIANAIGYVVTGVVLFAVLLVIAALVGFLGKSLEKAFLQGWRLL